MYHALTPRDPSFSHQWGKSYRSYRLADLSQSEKDILTSALDRQLGRSPQS